MKLHVSIITPAYNAARHLPSAIASVQAQTLTDWELIVINDGSTDDTAALLDRLTDARIRVIHQQNAGVSGARNAGLDAARGEYVTFLDADDVLPQDALEVRARFLDLQKDVDIVNGAVRVTAIGQLLRIYQPDLQQGPMAKRLARLEEGVFIGTVFMLRRSSIGDFRFPAGISHCEDLIFFLGLAVHKNIVYGAVSDIVYEYRVTAGSAMSNLDGLEAGYLSFLEFTADLGLSAEIRAHQRRRVRRILFRSWLRRGRVDRAVRSVFRVQSAGSR